MIAAIRSSMSMIGFCIALSSAKLSMSILCTIFFVSDTMAIALYTALSWATWYSGSNYNNPNNIIKIGGHPEKKDILLIMR